MPIVVNSNTTATVASFNLSRANDALRTSLARLSSGKRITNPSEDAGGLSVANKLASKLDRTEAVRQNIQNGISYLQVQDGALNTMAKLVDRMAELRTMASDVTKNTQDIENYSKEFIELQKQMNQMYHEKFNGISLFSMSRSQSINNPPDLRPTLDKNNAVFDATGRAYQTFSRNILTTADGVKQDGNISLNTVNLQYLLSLGGLDTTFITQTAAAIIAAQKSNDEQANNSDLLGERSFINIGNVNGANSDDWTDNSATNAIIDVMYKSDDALNATAFAAGAIAVGDYVLESGIAYEATQAVNAWTTAGAAAGYAGGTIVYNSADGSYYENTGATITTTTTGYVDGTAYATTDVITDSGKFYKSTAGHTSNGATFAADSANWTEISDPALPGHADSNADWTNLGTTFAGLQGAAGGVTFTEADKFVSQAEIDTYMTNEIYTEENFLQSIMFVSMGTFTDLIERVADARAENGAEQNRLNMTSELLIQNQTNLEAAHGRIMDADIALESTRFARQNVLVQSSAAMVAQANQLTNIALTILG
tara:strand:- start:5495 stop:7117 length:1623 start_codon:yes stop_codon:yes gene_type:complete